jgi:hypothetical protein
MASRVQSLEARCENQVRRRYGTRGEDYRATTESHRAAGQPVYTLHLGDSSTGGDEPGHDCIRTKVQTLFQQRPQYNSGEVVLGSDRARKSVTRSTLYAAVPTRTPGVVDRQRKRERMAAELPGSVFDAP